MRADDDVAGWDIVSDRDSVDRSFFDAYAMLTMMARSPDDVSLFTVVVPGILPGHGKRLVDCDDQELGALAILLRFDITNFRQTVRDARARCTESGGTE